MNEIGLLREKIDNFIEAANAIEIEQTAELKTKERLESEINRLVKDVEVNREALDIATHAIEILRGVSDEAVVRAYRFLEENLNAALAQMFKNSVRKIRLKEYTRDGQYPQLEIELETEGGIKRSLKADSGHGIAQIVSLLSILSIIVITGSRRLLVMDEIVSGLSVNNREVVSDILQTFTQIGFQFIVNEHGFAPKGSYVHVLEMVGGVSHLKQQYIEDKGVYLNGSIGRDDEEGGESATGTFEAAEYDTSKNYEADSDDNYEAI